MISARFAFVLLSLAFPLAAGACSTPPDPAPAPSAPPKLDQEVVDLAFHECFSGDCERAHAHLSDIPAAAPIRRSDAFRAIQYRFAADRMLHADADPDPAGRRAAYQAIADSADTDTLMRLAANERISRLGVTALSHASEVTLNARTDAGDPAALQVTELLRLSKSKDASDQNHVRAVLEPKMFSGKASLEDVMMLRRVCRAQADAACLRQLDRLIVH
jgi:hypothetical protein